ncbi:MAG: hypothetical protein KGO96_13940 [Elusimicrobia bacterium]|nr:hypothetical protein [Elusimicrobiota bacterium]
MTATTLTPVTVLTKEQQYTKNGKLQWKVQVILPDGSRPTASVWEEPLAAQLVPGAAALVDLQTSGRQNQFLDIRGVAPVPAGAMLPGIAPVAPIGAPGAPVAAPQASDPTTARIYRCTALQAAVGMWGPVAGRFSPESLRDEEGGLETLITMNRAVLQSADLFYAWLQGQAPQPGPGEKQEGEPF